MKAADVFAARLSRRAAGRCLAALVATAALSLPAGAQDAYPSKPITLIVPFAAGGTTDVVARIVAEGLRQTLGQTVVVENRGGAGGSIGTAAIVRATPDGYTIGMGSASTLTINPAVYKSLPYDVTTDLTPISNIAATPNIMSIHPGLTAKTMAEFIALAKARPGQFSYASPGLGSLAHLMGEQFKLATGTEILHVPYRGMGPALNDAAGGQVHVIFDNLPTSLALVQSGKLRPLALAAPRRVEALPSLPTFKEIGIDDLNWMALFGLIGPKGLPSPVVQRLHEALLNVLAMPDTRARLSAQQAIVVGNSPEAFRAQIERELARMRRAVDAAKIELP